jgi:hypothetical protein
MSAEHDFRADARLIYSELSELPGFAWPPGDPNAWTNKQCEWVYREGTDDSDEWIAKRRELIAAGLLWEH